MPKDTRYHRGFDELSRRVYPHLLNYSSEEDATEAIPALAKMLGISQQSLGAYIGQAKRHPGVYRLLARMGYADYQVPAWFARPKTPLEVHMVPPTPQVDNRITQTQTSTYAPSQVATNVPIVSSPQNFTGNKLEGEDYVSWFWKQPPGMHDFDVSRLEPGTYTARTLWPGDETQQGPKQVNKEDEQHRPSTQEEPKQQGPDIFTLLYWQTLTGNNTDVKQSQKAHNNLLNKTYIEMLKEYDDHLKTQSSGPSETDTIKGIVDAITPTIKAVLPSPDTMKQFNEDVAAIRAKGEEDFHNSLRRIKELRDEQRKAERHRLHLLAPDLLPDYE